MLRLKGQMFDRVYDLQIVSFRLLLFCLTFLKLMMKQFLKLIRIRIIS